MLALLVQSANGGGAVPPETTVADFLDLPEFDVPGAVSLGVSLLRSLPANAPASVRQPAQGLRSIVLALQGAWADPDARPGVDRCGASARLGNAWRALHSALKTATRLPAPRERSQLGQQLLSGVFPDGLEFLAWPTQERCSETTRRLDRIESERSWRAITLVTGHPEFLEVVKETHEACRSTLRSPVERQAAAATELEAQLHEFRRRVADYLVELAAWSRQDTGARASALRTALGSLDDEFDDPSRDDEARSSASSGWRRQVQEQGVAHRTGVTPQTPIPEVA